MLLYPERAPTMPVKTCTVVLNWDGPVLASRPEDSFTVHNVLIRVPIALMSRVGDPCNDC
jgi:hypothetical protein